MSDTFVNTCKMCGCEYDQNCLEKNTDCCEDCLFKDLEKINLIRDEIKLAREDNDIEKELILLRILEKYG